jgi:hypothetical protein
MNTILRGIDLFNTPDDLWAGAVALVINNPGYVEAALLHHILYCSDCGRRYADDWL